MNTRKLIAYSLLLSASTLLLLLASCDSGTETELTAGRDMPLPEGRYPLRFTATQEGNAVQTRVTEDASDAKKTLWTAGTDKIGVRIGEDGAAGEYTVAATDGSAMTAEQEVYWQDRNAAYIYGWFPAITDALPKVSGSSIDLSDQSSDKGGHLRFDFMKAKTTQQYQYDSEDAISLPFEHQMAKMNITLTSSDNLDLSDAKVEIYGYTSCTFDKGTVSTAGAQKGYITACCTDGSNHIYRAMVAPIEQSALDGNFIKVTLKNNESYYYKTGRKLEANKLYSYTVDVQKAALSPGDANAMRDIKGTVTIKGDGTVTNNPITVTGDATVTLDNVNIKVMTTGDANTTVIRVKGGKKLTLKVKGTNNSLEAVSGGGIVLESNASIVVEGDGIEQSKLVVKAGENGSSNNSYASTVGIGAACGASCGNIEIKNITIEVSGAAAWGSQSGAAIGTSTTGSTGSTVCGDITITGAHVTATGGMGAAAIGTGYSYSGGTTEQVGNITISGSTIVATVTSYYFWNKTTDYYGACIGLCVSWNGANYKCGTITITCNDGTAFLSNLKYKRGSKDTQTFGYKIGKGGSYSGGNVTFPGGTVNGTSSFTDGYGSFTTADGTE